MPINKQFKPRTQRKRSQRKRSQRKRSQREEEPEEEEERESEPIKTHSASRSKSQKLSSKEQSGTPFPDQDSEIRASELAERLMLRVQVLEFGEWLQEKKTLRLEENSIYLGDIDWSVEQFGSQLRLYRETKSRVPCISGIGNEDEEDVPLPLRLSVLRDTISLMDNNVKKLFPLATAPVVKEYSASEAKGLLFSAANQVSH